MRASDTHILPKATFTKLLARISKAPRFASALPERKDFVVSAAKHVVRDCVSNGLPFVQSWIAEAMLDRMDGLMQFSSHENGDDIATCMDTLVTV